MVVNRPSRRMRRKRIVYLILAGIFLQWLILNLLQLQLRLNFAIPCAYLLVIVFIASGIVILRKGSLHQPLQRLLERCGI